MASRSLGTLTLDLVAKIGGFQQNMDQASRSVAGSGSAAVKASAQVQVLERQFSSLAGVASRIAGPLAAAFSVNGIYNATEAYSTLTNRLKLVTNGTAELVTAQSAVFGIAQDARQPLTATAELYQRIATNQKELKLSGEGVAGIVGTISKTLAISGSSAESANAALIQLGQAFASGVLRGEELNSVLEQAPALAQAIAKGMGKTVGDLRNLGEQGLLTADAVVKALQNQEGAVDSLFSKMTATIGGSLTVVGNSITRYIGEIDQLTGASGKIAGEILAFAKTYDSGVPLVLDGIREHSDALSQILTTGLYVALGKVASGFAQQGAAALSTAVANQSALASTAALAKQDLLSAQAKQLEAKASVQRANLELSAAQGKVASDRVRQASELANIQSVQAALAAELALEQERLKAQINEQGRAASVARISEIRLAQVAVIKQVEAAERSLASTTVASSALVEKAYAGRTAATLAFAETTAAVNALSVASNNAAAAASVTGRAFSALASAGSGALAMMGGPVGLVFITAAAALSFIDFRSSADKAKEGLEQLQGPLDQVISRFKAMTEEQRAGALVRWSEAQVDAVKAAKGELDSLQATLKKGVLGSDSLSLPSRIAGSSNDETIKKAKAYEDLRTRIDEASKSGQSIIPILEEAGKVPGVPANFSDDLKKRAEAWSTQNQVAKEAEERQRILRGEMDKTAASAANGAAATGGMTTAGEKYLKTLQAQLGKLQDNNDAVKEATRYLDQHKELSEADRTAIMSVAYATKAQDEANKAATKSTKDAAKAQTSLKEQLKQAAAGFLDLKKSFDPVGAASEQFQKSTGQLNLLFKNGKITQEDYGKGTAWLAEQFNTASKAALGLSQAEEYRLELEKKLNNDRAQYASQAAAVGQGDKEAERAQQRLELERETNERLLSLRTELANATTEKQRNDLQAQIDLTNEYLPKQVDAMREGFRQIDEAQADWSNGARSAFANYMDSASNVAEQTKNLFSDALNGTEDALVNFVKTGKLSFRDLADSIVEDLIRIQIRQAAVGFLGGFAGLFSGGGGASTLGTGTMTGFSEGSMVMNAKGGVYDSPSLSSFSNQIHDSPQMFAFAKGAGIFAEAGPEAIMPLTRAADGSLGVRAIGNGDTSAAETAATETSSIGGITQYITVQGSADDATLARIQQAAKQGAQDGYSMVLRDLKMNGPARQLIARNR